MRRLLPSALILAASLLGGTSALAQGAPPRPTFVLGLESDDVEDQAEALTLALRSWVRTTPSWGLTETNQGLASLMIALKCPPKPDSACLQKIGDQLKTDRYFWGFMTKGTPSHVNAEVHLWQRGKPDAAWRDSYSDNLKDPAEEPLKRIAGRAFEKLTGLPVGIGTLVVSGPYDGAPVFVDGVAKGNLERGKLRLDLAIGPHKVELRPAGRAVLATSVTLVANGEATAAFAAAPPPATTDETAPAAAPRHDVSARAIAGWTSIGVGAVGLGIGLVEGVRFLSIRSDVDSERQGVPRTVSDVCSDAAQSIPAAVFACRDVKRARTARTIEFVAGGIGVAAAVVGVVLLVTDHGDDAAKEKAKDGASARVLPYTTGGSSGFQFVGSF